MIAVIIEGINYIELKMKNVKRKNRSIYDTQYK